MSYEAGKGWERVLEQPEQPFILIRELHETPSGIARLQAETTGRKGIPFRIPEFVRESRVLAVKCK